MNLELAANILKKGKALAPDRFPAIPANPDDAKLTLDAWAEALGALDFHPALWSEAVTLWATKLVGDRMVTPRDLIGAAFVVRDRWEGDPEKARVLDELRAARANRNYAKAGLDPITAADLPQYAGKPPEAVTEATRRQQTQPERIDAPRFIRRSQA